MIEIKHSKIVRGTECRQAEAKVLRVGSDCGKRLCDRFCLNGRGIREHEKWTLTVAGNRREVVHRIIRHRPDDQPPQYMNTRRGEKRITVRRRLSDSLGSDRTT